MTNALRWTSADLERLPDDGKRYEIVMCYSVDQKSANCANKRQCLVLISVD